MSFNHTQTEQRQPSNMAGWIRLAAAAQYAKVTADTLAGWCARGEIPVAMRVHGARLRFVNAAQFHTWNSTPHALFDAGDLARANRDFPPAAKVEDLF